MPNYLEKKPEKPLNEDEAYEYFLELEKCQLAIFLYYQTYYAYYYQKDIPLGHDIENEKIRLAESLVEGNDLRMGFPDSNIKLEYCVPTGQEQKMFFLKPNGMDQKKFEEWQKVLGQKFIEKGLLFWFNN